MRVELQRSGPAPVASAVQMPARAGGVAGAFPLCWVKLTPCPVLVVAGGVADTGQVPLQGPGRASPANAWVLPPSGVTRTRTWPRLPNRYFAPLQSSGSLVTA